MVIYNHKENKERLVRNMFIVKGFKNGVVESIHCFGMSEAYRAYHKLINSGYTGIKISDSNILV